MPFVWPFVSVCKTTGSLTRCSSSKSNTTGTTTTSTARELYLFQEDVNFVLVHWRRYIYLCSATFYIILRWRIQLLSLFISWRRNKRVNNRRGRFFAGTQWVGVGSFPCKMSAKWNIRRCCALMKAVPSNMIASERPGTVSRQHPIAKSCLLFFCCCFLDDALDIPLLSLWMLLLSPWITS